MGFPIAMQAFPIEPGSIKGLGLIGLVLLVVLGVVAALIGASLWSARSALFEVSEARRGFACAVICMAG